ncbi:MAG: tryptophan synthase subunit alpha [Prolixibacteraceae bacterium]|nr:tryptophan synthase subunit alpha [Prolixibacteraceae bacterium]
MITNRINKLFQGDKKNILSVYFTAGYPKLDDTVPTIQGLEKHGVDLIEIGIPFSDPLADGPVIQGSSHIALQNGISVKCIFEQLKDIRKSVRIPLIVMGYLNPVISYGIEAFCKKCNEIGIDGMILPDLPLNEYNRSFKSFFEKYNLHNVLLITPETSEKRLHEIDDASTGFIYMVSTSSTTGAKKNVSDYSTEYFQRVNNMKLKNRRLIGFGISNHKTFDNACKYAQGAIIGSAFVKAVSQEGTLDEKIEKFVKSIK